jgi:hypothetical protein
VRRAVAGWDTSSWIQFLRRGGDGAVRARVEAALHAGTALWCPLIRLELWNGAGGAREEGQYHARQAVSLSSRG